MKEVTQEHTETRVEIVSEQQQRKEIKIIGRQKKIPGLILWEFNEKTKILTEAKFKPISVFISSSLNSSNTTKTYKCVVNENCIYFQSLNRHNAEKKLKRAKLL